MGHQSPCLPWNMPTKLLFFKKGCRKIKENDRPVSIHLVISKIFEKLIRKQLSTFFESILSELRYCFWKEFSTQHCLLVMLNKWKKAVDNNQALGALFTDFSKVFDSLILDLLIVKLLSDGISLSSSKFTAHYLKTIHLMLNAEIASIKTIYHWEF